MEIYFNISKILTFEDCFLVRFLFHVNMETDALSSDLTFTIDSVTPAAQFKACFLKKFNKSFTNC